MSDLHDPAPVEQQPLQQTVQITNKRGLHARASAKFVTLASGQTASVEVEKDGSKVAGTSIMGLMMLGAAKGDHVVITASGDGAEQALTLLVELVENKFGEE
jgi:phosphocarrier protein